MFVIKTTALFIFCFTRCYPVFSNTATKVQVFYTITIEVIMKNHELDFKPSLTNVCLGIALASLIGCGGSGGSSNNKSSAAASSVAPASSTPASSMPASSMPHLPLPPVHPHHLNGNWYGVMNLMALVSIPANGISKKIAGVAVTMNNSVIPIAQSTHLLLTAH
jgi:hypothetical protein